MVDWMNPSQDALDGRQAGRHDKQNDIDNLEGEIEDLESLTEDLANEVEGLTEERDDLQAIVDKLVDKLPKENSYEAVGVHGPNECPAGACDGCEGFHHWLPECADDDTQTPPGIEPHPAIQSGLSCWFECKHCSAWCEEMEETIQTLEG